MSCSDYSVLMLIGPLVRQLAATAPGLTIQVLPRAPTRSACSATARPTS